MQCKLCLEEKELIKKSHIIPRQFFHKSSEDIDKGFGNVKTGDKNPRLYSKKAKSKQIQSGTYVPNILCKNCEQKLGVLDNYAQTLLLTKVNTIEDHLKIENIDYKKIKLFFISILWRSQICGDDFFGEVSLNNDLEAKLRDMIIQNNPGDENDFSILLFRFSGIEANFFCVKKLNKPFESYYYRLANYTCIIKVDERCYPADSEQYKCMLKPEQCSLIIPILDYTKTKEYQLLINNIDQYQQ